MRRVLHFSDVHLEGPLAGVDWLEWTNKRAAAWVVQRLLRRASFLHAGPKLDALARFAAEHEVDLSLCTGDLTALGTAPELMLARKALAPFERSGNGLVALPGNHDIYLPRSLRDRRFERAFGDLLRTDRPDLAADGPWPVVRRVGDAVAIVALNSARPNPPVWRSSGRIPRAQLDALERIVGDAELAERFLVVATHHAPRLPSGRPDTRRHGLVDARAVRRVLERMRRGIFVHGHVHHCFHLGSDHFGVPIFGAGSATHGGREGFWLYELGPEGGWARRGRWNGDRYELVGPRVRAG